MYEIGSYVIKSLNGICKVEDIVQMDGMHGEKKKQYYYLSPVNEPTGKLYVSLDHASNSTRKIMSPEEAYELIRRIDQIEELWIDNEKRRELLYKEAVKSNDPEKLVGIIKVIYLRRQKRLEQGRKSTATDERYFKMAEDFLYSEIGFALGKNKDEVCRLIQKTIQEETGTIPQE